MTVAALFVDPEGPYPKIPNVECWDNQVHLTGDCRDAAVIAYKLRDARKYAGPHPVVAHPPCHLWVNLTAVNYKRYGGAHNRPGNDGGRFKAALKAVRKYGGVLEHPAGSKAWEKYGLTKPTGRGWIRVEDDDVHAFEWVCEVWQSAYGHKARKRTWLLFVGPFAPPELRWARRAGTHQCGWFDRIKPTLGKAEASRTPMLFARELVMLAQASRWTEKDFGGKAPGLL